MIEDQSTEKYLIKLKDSKQQLGLQTLKQKLSEFPKYFHDTRSNTTLIYDRTCVYIVSKKQHKVTDLGKTYTIIQLVYNPVKNILVFLTSDGLLYGHFISGKTQFVMKKNIKSWVLFDWVYEAGNNVDFFLVDSSGVKFYKVDEEKKSFKEMKSTSGKFNSALYDPITQVIAAFPVGDCRVLLTFLFDEDRQKSWFKGPKIPIGFEGDEELMIRVKKHKSLGFKNSTTNMELFTRTPNEEYYSELIRMNNKSYLMIYFGNEGKLKLHPIIDDYSPQKEVIIKLPSDSIPLFNVIDNMLIINLRNEKITFIYDINANGAQMLVSPFPIQHESRKNVNPYTGSFIGKRHILPEGIISKWQINLQTIHYYLKSENQIFEFLHKRKKAKMVLLSWLRKNLLNFKQINISKFWKLMFLKTNSNNYGERDIITLVQLYANAFYTLSIDELTPKQPLLNAIIECFRQANQLQMKIPSELQKLTLELLLDCKKYELLVFLCHNDIIKDTEEFADFLIQKGIQKNSQILLTLGIDMANRICKHQKIFQYLIKMNKIRQAKRYLKTNYENLQVFSMISVGQHIEDQRIKKDYVNFAKLFVSRKFPNTLDKYLEDAESITKK